MYLAYISLIFFTLEIMKSYTNVPICKLQSKRFLNSLTFSFLYILLNSFLTNFVASPKFPPPQSPKLSRSSMLDILFSDNVYHHINHYCYGGAGKSCQYSIWCGGIVNSFRHLCSCFDDIFKVSWALKRLAHRFCYV